MSVNWQSFYEKDHLVHPLSKEMDEREQILWDLASELLPAESIEKLLDVGCGPGHITNKFRERGIPHVQGCDISPYGVNFASTNHSQCNFEVSSITDLRYPSNSFDLVSALELLEHIDDLDCALRELVRVSRRWVLVTVPFEQKIPIMLCPFCLNHFNCGGHLHSFSQRDLVDLFSKHGLRVTKISYRASSTPAWEQRLKSLHIGQSVIAALTKTLIQLKLTQAQKPSWMGLLGLKSEIPPDSGGSSKNGTQ